MNDVKSQNPRLEIARNLRDYLHSNSLATFFAIITLSLLFLKFTWGFWDYWDLPLYDGAFYYKTSYDLALYGTLPDPQWSPAFIAYYSLFHHVFEQSENVYMAQRFVMHLILVLLSYLVLKQFSNFYIAWALSIVSIFTINIFVSHYGVHLFVLIPIWLLYLVSTMKNNTLRHVLIFALFIILVYIRPEYIIGLFFFLIWCIFQFSYLRDKQTIDNKVSRFAGILLVLMIFTSALIFWHTSSGSRSMLAFTQHYGWGYSERNPQWSGSIDFWTKSAPLIQDQFDGATSVLVALERNTKAFSEHALWNLYILPREFLNTLHLELPGFSRLLRFLFASSLLIIIFRGFDQPKQLFTFISRHKTMLMITTGLLTSILVSSIVIRPRELYLLALQPSIFVMIACATTTLLRQQKLHYLSIVTVPLFVLLIFRLPTPMDTSQPQPIIQIANMLPRYETRHTILADAPTGFCYYQNPNPLSCGGQSVLGIIPETDVGDLIDKRNIRIILINQRMLNNLTLEQRMEIMQIVNAPEVLGWEVMEANNTLYSIYIR